MLMYAKGLFCIRYEIIFFEFQVIMASNIYHIKLGQLSYGAENVHFIRLL